MHFFFPAVYSIAAIPINIFVRLGLVEMFVTKKQLWEKEDFTEPAGKMKILMLFLLFKEQNKTKQQNKTKTQPVIKPSSYRQSTGCVQNPSNLK